MRRAGRDFASASTSEETADDDDTSAAPPGDPPAYQQARRPSRDLSSASADNNTQLHQIVTPGGGEEFVDILQVQQLLLENAGVSSGTCVSGRNNSRVIGHLHRTSAVEYPHLGLEAAVRGRMLLENYPPTVPTIPHHHHHHHPPPPQPPPPPPPYYYANYVQQQQQQHQPSSVEDLFALWLGSTSGAGRLLFYSKCNRWHC